MCHDLFIIQIVRVASRIYGDLPFIEVVGTLLYPRMIFTKCFKMSVDESQWTHGFDVNWCDNFLLQILQYSYFFYSLFFAILDIAFATPTDGFLYFY